MATPPTDDQLISVALDLDPVSSHSVNWYPSSWLEDLDARAKVPELRRATERIASDLKAPMSGRSPISRADVVRQFEQSRGIDAYLASIIWGCGTGARNRYRMLRVLAENDDVVSKIEQLVAACATAGRADAWNILLTTHRLKHLGIAFGTKVAYFAALAARGPNAGIPLIADGNVAIATGEPVTRRKDAYLAYCARADELATQLKGERQRPDQIELALFKLASRQSRGNRHT